MTSPPTHHVYDAMNKPLTVLGVERRLFFLAASLGAGTFNFFGSSVGGIAMFVVLFLAARVATRRDPQMLRILLNSARLRSHYDPAKYMPSGNHS